MNPQMGGHEFLRGNPKYQSENFPTTFRMLPVTKIGQVASLGEGLIFQLGKASISTDFLA
jgi:hypothetical protein